MDTTFSMFTPASERTMAPPLPLPAPPRPRQPLTEVYRPRSLSELVGQPYVVRTLQHYADNPYPQVFLLSGYTGTGKTSAAYALASELGVDPNWSFSKVRSGELDADAIDREWKQLRFAAPNGNRPWKLLLCDEADRMTQKASDKLLSMLEDIPPYSIVVFTTNEPEKFKGRFLDRCEHIRFTSDATTLWPDAQALLARLWSAEGMPGDCPNVRTIPGILDGANISFRRIVRYVEAQQHAIGVERPKAPIGPYAANAAAMVKAPTVKAPGTRHRNTNAFLAAIDWDAARARFASGRVSQRGLASELGCSLGKLQAELAKPST